jgi:hypothetical protein
MSIPLSLTRRLADFVLLVAEVAEGAEDVYT